MQYNAAIDADAVLNVQMRAPIAIDAATVLNVRMGACAAVSASTFKIKLNVLTVKAIFASAVFIIMSDSGNYHIGRGGYELSCLRYI